MSVRVVKDPMQVRQQQGVERHGDEEKKKAETEATPRPTRLVSTALRPRRHSRSRFSTAH